MDASKCKALADLCDSLTTSGESQLDQKKLKELKKICRLSEEYVIQCFELLWSQLKRDHAEIRLSTFQIIDELFRRSHRFRELLLDNFQSYLELTLEIDLDLPLPPPKAAATKLKNSAYQALRSWHETYSSGYRKLELAFNYLRNCHQVDFNKADHMSALQRQREEEARLKVEVQRKRVMDKVMEEIAEYEGDIIDFSKQLTTCFKLLLPSQDVFDVFDGNLFSTEAQDGGKATNEDEEESCEQGEMKEHGLLNRKANVNINISEESVVRESEDNTDIIHNLDELKVLLTIKYMPMLVRWLATLQKCGAEQEIMSKLIDLKLIVQKSLKDLDMLTIRRVQDGDDDDDEDLMEVPEEVDEVAFFKSRLGMTGKPSSGSEPSTSSGLKNSAPVVAYDLDLKYWESPDELTIPEALPNDTSRGWVALPDRSDASFHSSLQELYSSRKIEFSGKFVPVKWTCRAPLTTGRLCPRMDRVKCPFHGPIIARDADGSPASDADAAKLAKIKEKQRAANPEWQDPALLKDIEAETGLNLTVETSKKKGGKQKSKLTNINKTNCTTRSRLESKVLSRRAMKRVASAMNRLDNKKLKDKFCHSFTATFAV